MQFSAFQDSGEFKPNVSQSASDWAELGTNLLAVGRPADAVTAFSTALALKERGLDTIWPEDEFFFHLGDALLYSGDVSGAREAYQKSYALEDSGSVDEQDLRPSRALPQVQRLSTEKGVQEALARPYRSANPDMDYLHALGCSFSRCYWEADAIEVLANFLPSATTAGAEAWWGLGISYIEDKRSLELCKRAMRNCTEWDPKFDLAFSELGRLYVLLKQPQEAVASFEAAMRIGGHDPQYYAHYELYALAVGLTQKQEQIAEVVKVLRARSSTNEALLQALEATP
ncbi:lipopolysaccharide assembly protein LapB [Hydrogenophaga sp. IBVHS1]|uniref:tetratricopeptide repeat protein n=1 Tax=unclassified Hydrogenophaga TaxID=2610897 RepID=UPI000A2E3E40|nr:tetratricopeptide repeat protein [Hydrogenophaga sp. IBVHS1]OSZ71560.1 hypothetical protein CAP37_20300 [Hydrogenophaga sp. IBVHS1]